MVYEKWTNQKEAYHFAMTHPFVMLNMDMGTGKTRVAIDVALDRQDVHKVLVVCPKAVIPVWKKNLEKFAGNRPWWVLDFAYRTKLSVKQKAEKVKEIKNTEFGGTIFVVLNYDVVWRAPLGDTLRKIGFDMIILDESHRAKSAGSKVSKYLHMLGKNAKYRMCLSGTPMANSPLDVYGQYRFLDHNIFGTRYNVFQEQYAVLGGPERKFVVGFKNLRELNEKFQSIAYTCRMDDIKDRLKLPDKLPPNVLPVDLPTTSYNLMKKLGKEFIAEFDGQGEFVVLKNILGKILRFQQITSGFVPMQSGPLAPLVEKELHTVKEEALACYLADIPANEKVVVFCLFKRDLEAIHRASYKAGRDSWELSGDRNDLESWYYFDDGDVLAVQIQAGAEGIDLTQAHYGIYYNLPHSLAQYEQSLARLYRPGQTQDVRFTYILARDTIDEDIFESLQMKTDIITRVQQGELDFKFLK